MTRPVILAYEFLFHIWGRRWYNFIQKSYIQLFCWQAQTTPARQPGCSNCSNQAVQSITFVQIKLFKSSLFKKLTSIYHLTVQIKPGRPTKLAQVTITVTGTEALVYFAQAMLRPKLRRTGTAGHPLRPSGQPAGSRGSVGAARPAGRDGVNGYVGRDGSDGARGSQGWPRGSVGAYLRRTRGRTQ